MTQSILQPSAQRILLKIAPVVLLAAFFSLGCASDKGRAFATPQAACDALITALRANNSEELTKILGPDGSDLIASGDAIADQQSHSQFLQSYDQKHALTATGDDVNTLIVGPQDWPLPIPIVRENQSWSFDTAAGRDEILNRRIGQNELSAMQVCLAIADAEREYVAKDWNGDGTCEYAQKILSTPGQKNGLYWATAAGEPSSPLGVLIATAEAQGYPTTPRAPADPRRSYHGYHYRILKSQGPSAPGGALDYVVGGKMIAGFAIVAWPATYGNSGVMTFIVNQSGVIYQDDLGEGTDRAALSMTAFNPGAGWAKVEAPPVQ